MRAGWLRLPLLTLFLTGLYGCGVAHVKTQVAAEDWQNYRSAYIKDVRVYSEEAAAVSNEALQTKMAGWQAQSLRQITQFLERSRLNLLPEPPAQPDNTLAVEIDTNVRYGNRALRYFVGFGAGKGTVNSTLSVTDAESGETKFQAESESSLSVGIGGGDMGRVLESNVEKLIEQLNTETELNR